MKRAVEAEDHSGQRPCHTATGRRWQRDEGRAARLRRSRRSWIGISWLSRIRCPCLPCFGARLPALRSRIAACIPAGLGASFDSFPFLDRIQDRFPVLDPDSRGTQNPAPRRDTSRNRQGHGLAVNAGAVSARSVGSTPDHDAPILSPVAASSRSET